MDHNRCSATAVSAIDRDATLEDNVAGSATGSHVFAVRADAVAGKDSFGVVANPDDNVRHAVVDPAANCVDASCCLDRDLGFDPGHGRDCGPSHGCSVAAVVVLAANADLAAATDGSVPAVVGLVPSAAVLGCHAAVAVAVVPNAVAVPGYHAVAAVAAAPNAVAVPDYHAVAAVAVAPNAAVVPDCRAVAPGDAVPSVVAVGLVVVERLVALGPDSVFLVGAAAGADRVRLDFAAS